MDGYFQYNVK